MPNCRSCAEVQIYQGRRQIQMTTPAWQHVFRECEPAIIRVQVLAVNTIHCSIC